MNINIRSLMPQFFKLSKSTIIKGMQCERYLYLLKNKPKEKTAHDKLTLHKFAQGHDFEATFKSTFAAGIDINTILKKDVWALGAAYTSAVLNEQKPVVLFEACFIFNNTLIMADVCVQHEDGSFDIYEVKNNTEEKDVFVRDMAIQYYVVKHASKGLKHFNLVLNDGNNGFLIKDMTSILKAYEPEIKKTVDKLLDTLKLPLAPEIMMGEQCHHPYDCEYIAYCSRKNN